MPNPTGSAGGAFLPGGDYGFTGQQTFTGGFVDAMETGSTSTPLVNYGGSKISITSSTSAGSVAKAYTLALPVTGSRKTIIQPTASTGGTTTVTSVSGAQFNAAGATIATFSSAAALSLMATSSSAWAVVSGSTGNVTFS